MTTIFISGTGTEVGKTHVTALLAQRETLLGKRVGVYKPVASGCDPDSADNMPAQLGKKTTDAMRLRAADAEIIWEAAGRPLTVQDVCPQRFLAPLAPNEAARQQSAAVDKQLLVDGLNRWRDDFDVVFVEGAGGLFSPIADGMLNLDFYLQLAGAELHLVAANALGVIHQTIATCRAASAAGAEIKKIYLNATTANGDESQSTNAGQIRDFCDGIDVEVIPYKDVG